jgi:hypothetical protein
MSTPTVTPGAFVPSRFLQRQLYSIGAGSAVIIAAFVIWPKWAAWLLTTTFLPHAYCYLGNPSLVWSHVVADSLIAIAYLGISITLGYLGFRGRRDIPFHWMFLAFGLFILARGGTHLMEAITIWTPVYILSAAVKVFTAMVSLTRAAVLPFTVPHAFNLVRQAKISEQVTAKLRQRGKKSSSSARSSSPGQEQPGRNL